MLGLLAGMAVSLALPVVALPVAAQDFPSKPIRIIAPFGPGTATDTVARVIANEMGKRWWSRTSPARKARSVRKRRPRRTAVFQHIVARHLD